MAEARAGSLARVHAARFLCKPVKVLLADLHVLDAASDIL